MQPIECDILYINAEMDQYIADNPTASIKRFYEQKEIELTNKYEHSLVAKYWPELRSKDSGFMKKKKLIPNLPESINDLEDLPEDYKLTTTKQRFLRHYHL